DEALIKLQAGRLDVDDLVTMANRRFDLAWRQSVERKWMRNAKKHANLYEHLYKLEVDQKTEYEAADALFKRSFLALLEGFGFAEKLRERWVRVATFDFSNYDMIPVFYVDGAKVHAMPDFVGQRHDGVIELIDWKTGRESHFNQTQITFYYLMAREGALEKRFEGAREAKLEGRLVDLGLDGKQEAVPEVEEDLEHLRDQIRRDVAKMRGLTNEVALEGRQLLEFKDDDEAKFERTHETSACARCAYLYLCRQEMNLPTQADAQRWLRKQRAEASGEAFIEDDEANED
ncbi:MAG: PD-(D/E)XK nuclease family protein, partial [Planctomycetes bacterium]|nr:PD-(D/E)XK nuclease family protein [Planctomycetota bacterium]